MDLHRRPHRCPSRTPLKGGIPQYPGGGEGNPIGTCLPTGGRSFPTPSTTCFLPMVCMHVDRQKPKRHLHPALFALYLTPLPVPVGRPCYRHMSPIRRLKLHSSRLERAVDHCDCLNAVGLQSHPVEQYQQCDKVPLEPSRV